MSGFNQAGPSSYGGAQGFGPGHGPQTKSTEELVGEFGGILDALMAPQEQPRQK